MPTTPSDLHACRVVVARQMLRLRRIRHPPHRRKDDLVTLLNLVVGNALAGITLAALTVLTRAVIDAHRITRRNRP